MYDNEDKKLTLKSLTSFLDLISSTNGIGFPFRRGMVAIIVVFGVSSNFLTSCLKLLLNISIFPISSITYTGLAPSFC